MATGSVLASTAGYAYADAGAVGAAADSPGVGSGNTVQVPIDVPVNLCGDTISVVGLLNPAMGNDCSNASAHRAAAPGPTGPKSGATGRGGSGRSTGHGTSTGSPGVGSGNTVQVPVQIPANACGLSLTAVGLGNSSFGNQCANHGGGSTAEPTAPGHPCTCTPPPSHHQPPPPPSTPPATPPVQHHGSPPPPPSVPQTPAPAGAVLASTGAGNTMLLAPIGAAMALGGLLLYRRARPGQR